VNEKRVRIGVFVKKLFFDIMIDRLIPHRHAKFWASFMARSDAVAQIELGRYEIPQRRPMLTLQGIAFLRATQNMFVIPL